MAGTCSVSFSYLCIIDSSGLLCSLSRASDGKEFLWISNSMMSSFS